MGNNTSRCKDSANERKIKIKSPVFYFVFPSAAYLIQR